MLLPYLIEFWRNSWAARNLEKVRLPDDCARKVNMNGSIISEQKLPGIVAAILWSKPRTKFCLPALALTFAFAVLPLTTTAGEDKSAADCTGTWKVTHYGTNNQASSSQQILKLKLDDGALTGTLGNVSTSKRKSRVKEWPIKEAKLQGDEISFTVAHPIDGGSEEVISFYQGKISGDSMTGTFKVEVLGRTFTRNWEAERLHDLPAITSNSPAQSGK